MKMKKCNKCKNTEFEVIERSNTYNVKGNTNIEIQERVMQCSSCGEIIFNEEEDFLKIMDILVDSFLASAIFEVNDQNQIQLVGFSVWLSELGKVHLFGTHMDDLSAYSHVLIQTFED